MGLYDRDYGRSEQTPWDRIENPRSFIVILIAVNVVFFVAQLLFSYRSSGPLDPALQELKLTPEQIEALPIGKSRESYLSDYLSISGLTLTKPWLWFRVLTYGFLHDTHNIFHIAFNMFLLFVFGRPVEQKLGGHEFLKCYLAAIIVGGITAMVFPWLLSMIRYGGIDPGIIGGTTLGASGAVVAMTVLFACYFPQQEVLLMFIFPIKAWVLACLVVAGDLFGAIGSLTGASSTTAFEVHLAGAIFGFLYAKRHWSFERFDLMAIGSWPSLIRQRSRRAKLKLHDPEKKIRAEAAEADKILAKIHESGEDSLTSSERRTLEKYSRRQRQNREQ